MLMNRLGISFFSGGFQYSLFRIDGGNIQFVERIKCTNPAVDRIRESSEWVYNALDELNGRHPIDRIGFKLHFNLNSMKDFYSHGAPVGVLAYFCAEKNIPLEGYTVSKIKGYRFLNLTRGTKTLDWIDQNHKDAGMYWDNNARYSTAIAVHRCQES